MAAARPGWVILNEVSGSSLPASVSGHIGSLLVSCRLYVCGTKHILQLCIMLVCYKRQCKKLMTCFLVMVIVLNQSLPLALSRLTVGCLLKKVKKPVRNLRILLTSETERPRSIQALAKTVDSQEGPCLSIPNVVLLSARLA